MKTDGIRPRALAGKRPLALAAMLALTTACAGTASEMSASPGAAVRPVVVRHSGPAHHLTMECTGEARPDRVVIAGAMTAESGQPLDAQAQLDRQLAELRQYVDAEKGRIELLERVRAARSLGENRGNRPEPPPFLALQRLEIEFPATIAIDAAFERVMQLGLDRFGSNIRVDYVDRRRHVAVRYRFSALQRELDRIHAHCRADAVARWCANEGADRAVCALTPQEREARLKTRALTLRTQQLLNERGGTSTYHLNYPWRSEQLARIEPVGDIAVGFHGTLQLDVADPQP